MDATKICINHWRASADAVSLARVTKKVRDDTMYARRGHVVSHKEKEKEEEKKEEEEE